MYPHHTGSMNRLNNSPKIVCIPYPHQSASSFAINQQKKNLKTYTVHLGNVKSQKKKEKKNSIVLYQNHMWREKKEIYPFLSFFYPPIQPQLVARRSMVLCWWDRDSNWLDCPFTHPNESAVFVRLLCYISLNLISSHLAEPFTFSPSSKHTR